MVHSSDSKNFPPVTVGENCNITVGNTIHIIHGKYCWKELGNSRWE
jgi:hypothetical protein